MFADFQEKDEKDFAKVLEEMEKKAENEVKWKEGLIKRMGL